MAEIMGMTNKQFQGFIRLALGWLDKALEESPDNKSLQSLKDIFQTLLSFRLPKQPLQHLHILPELPPAELCHGAVRLGFPVHECFTDGYVPGFLQLLKLCAQIPVRSLRDLL